MDTDHEMEETLAAADFCGKNYGFLRIFPRSFTILRTDQGRGYAMLRIFTGKA